MSRSIKKGPYTDQNLLKKIQEMKTSKKEEPIKTWARDAVISPEMVGFNFLVYNGKEFLPVKISESMVGHKLGEFSYTTKFFKHGGRMQREIEAQVAENEAAKVSEVKEGETAPKAAKTQPAKPTK